MRPEHPRSVSACYEEVNAILSVLAMSDGEDRVACRRLAAALRGRCVAQSPARLMEAACTTCSRRSIEGNGNLGVSIGKCFLVG